MLDNETTAQTAAEAFARYRDAFEAKFVRGADDECWPWTAQKRSHGYGGFRMGRVQLAHVAAVLLDGRKIPAGMVVDHECRNRLCVNPAHLRVVTKAQNTLENSAGVASRNAAKTHCIHGHELSGNNLIRRDRKRECRACLNVRVSRYHKRLRLADGMVECLSRVPSESAHG